MQQRDPLVRAYLGVPLRSPAGHNIGSLCVMDVKPRAFSKKEIDVMRDLAPLVVDELDPRKIAFVDSLTGAMTRRAFLTEAGKEFHRARRHKRDLACIVFDLDHFKSINDLYGHAAGDYVLARVTAACRQSLRTNDHIGRLGGEEFAIVMPETGVDAAQVAESLRLKISSLVIEQASRDVRISASFGVAILNRDDIDFKGLLARADEALYRAKAQGRNTVARSDSYETPIRAA